MQTKFKVRKEGEWYYIFRGKEKVTTKLGNPLIGVNDAIMSCATDEMEFSGEMLECPPCNMTAYVEQFTDIHAANGFDALREAVRKQWQKSTEICYPRIEHCSMLMTKAINYLRNSIPTMIDELDECQLVAVNIMLTQYPIDLIKRIITDFLPIDEDGEIGRDFLTSFCHQIGKVAITHKIIKINERVQWEENLHESIDTFCFFFNHAGHPHQNDIYVEV